MLHVSARSFRNVFLAATLVTVVAAPAAAGPAPVVPAAGATADAHRSYALDAGRAHAEGTIEVTETRVNVTGTLRNHGDGQAWVEYTVYYSTGSRAGARSYTKRLRRGHGPISTDLSLAVHGVTVDRVEVDVCHRTDWGRAPRCNQQVLDF